MKYNEALQAPILEAAKQRIEQRREIFAPIETANKYTVKFLEELCKYCKDHEIPNYTHLDRRVFNLEKNIKRNNGHGLIEINDLQFVGENAINTAIKNISLVDTKAASEFSTKFNKAKKLIDLAKPINNGMIEFRHRDNVNEPTSEYADKLSVGIADNLIIPAYKKGLVSKSYPRSDYNVSTSTKFKKYKSKKSIQYKNMFIKMFGVDKLRELEKKHKGILCFYQPLTRYDDSGCGFEISIDKFKKIEEHSSKETKIYHMSYNITPENCEKILEITPEQFDKFVNACIELNKFN